jgi:hypothetical protein
MLDFIYVLTIWSVAVVLFVSVDKLEPNRRLALALKFLILAVGVVAVARRLLP